MKLAVSWVASPKAASAHFRAQRDESPATRATNALTDLGNDKLGGSSALILTLLLPT